MEFSMEFATFCNICFRNEGLRQIQENEQLLETLMKLIENEMIIKRDEIYLCAKCCAKLESYNQFKEMCLKNFLNFRVEYSGLKKKLETCNDPNIEKKLTSFIESRIYKSSGSFKMYDSEDSVKDEPESDESFTEQQDEIIDIKYDLRSENSKINKFECVNIEDYKFHSELNLENSEDGFEQLNHYVKQDIDATESSIKSEYENPAQSTEAYMRDEEFYITDNLIQHTTQDSQFSSLNKNEESTDQETQENQCKVCQKTFVSIHKLKKHSRIHTSRKTSYTCTICNKSFSQVSTLKVHQVIHTREKNYSCDVCNKTYYQPGSLEEHKRVHAGIKPHVCNICNRAFTFPTRLKTHMLTHTDQKLFNCTICNKNFRRSQNLKMHIRRHAGQKPFPCAMCDMTFNTSRKRNMHELVHTGEKSYIEECGK